VLISHLGFRCTILWAAVLSALANAPIAHARDRAGTTTSCNDLPSGVSGLCRTPLFRSYVACIERTIPNWDEKGPRMQNHPEFLPSHLVLAVLIECEPDARMFGQRYGNKFANILQSVANQRVSRQYGTTPLSEPAGNLSVFLTYGDAVSAEDAKPGDLHDDRTGTFRRPSAAGATVADQQIAQVTDLLKAGPGNPSGNRSCSVQVEGTNLPCDVAWFVSFKDGTSSVQFNKGTGSNPMIAFFGRIQKDGTVSVDTILLKEGDHSDELQATGQCSPGNTAMGCQGRMSDGRFFTGTVFVQQ
jgi:hypothetical protein